MKPQYNYEWNFPNFTPEEVTCRCKCGLMPTEEAMIQIQTLRNLCGFSLPVTSGARCAKHNASVGGAKNSYHVKGMAFDIRVNRKKSVIIKRNLNLLWFHGTGTSLKSYWGFVHLDIRPIELASDWSY